MGVVGRSLDRSLGIPWRESASRWIGLISGERVIARVRRVTRRGFGGMDGLNAKKENVSMRSGRFGGRFGATTGDFGARCGDDGGADLVWFDRRAEESGKGWSFGLFRIPGGLSDGRVD